MAKPTIKKSKRQAVVIFHGMGEQVPMTTVRSFVSSVWQKDESLINRARPVQGSDSPRQDNPTWSKPDPTDDLFETQRITTEKGDNGAYTDFYELYWAHLVHGTTWDQVAAWIKGLLLRNPFKRVPKDVMLAWLLLWAITLIIGALALWSAWPKDPDTTPAWLSLFFGAGSIFLAWVVSAIMIPRFGDVVRYTKAEPLNIERREEIRKRGVKFLEKLIHARDPRNPSEPLFDRIVVVAHSLGTMVAYDVLSECFARNCRADVSVLGNGSRFPARAALEDAVRRTLGWTSLEQGDVALTADKYQQMQSEAFLELNAQGTSWPVSDFVTLGSPLTHAEFLLSESEEDLRNRQQERLYPTCPPLLEFDGRTKCRHFSFRAGDIAKVGKLTAAQKNDPIEEARLPRWPHHASVFGYTRWTNLYSPHRGVITGDVISGPLAAHFGLKNGERAFCGIKDIAVMPALDPHSGKVAKGHKRRLFTHNRYWAMDGGTEKNRKSSSSTLPHHISELRKALDLGRDI